MSTCVRRSGAKCARVRAVDFPVSEPNPSSSPTQAPVLPPNPREAKRPLGQPVRWWGAPFTLVLIGICVVVALLSRLGEDRGVLNWLFFTRYPFRAPDEAGVLHPTGLFLPEVLRGGQVWRLLTPMFIHYGPFHLLFNMFWLRDLGGILERRYGAVRFCLLVVVTELASSFAEYFLGTSTAFGGMSGVVYGLFGYIWVVGRVDPSALGFTFSPQTTSLMMLWFFLCFTGALGPIANYAHAGGLITGAALGWIVARRSMRDVLARRKQFQQSIEEAGDGPLHRCHVCGRTERDADGSLDFRVSSVDGEEYCEEHLPARPSLG